MTSLDTMLQEAFKAINVEQFNLILKETKSDESFIVD